MNHCAPILVTSMLATLMSRIRFYLMSPKKNKLLADQLTPVFKQIAEQLLPYYCTTMTDNHAHVNKVHHLVFLLVQKVKDSFFTGIIRGCLDQNWSLKGLRQALVALLKTLSIKDCKEPLETIEQQIRSQNLQSAACIAAFVQQVRQANKEIELDSLKNIVDCYETDFKTVEQEVNKFRQSSTPLSCISTINSWAYDLKKFDLKLTMDNDLTKLIQSSLNSQTSQVFWTSYFKCQSGVSTDDFFDAIREVCCFSQMSEFYNSSTEHYEILQKQLGFRIMLKENGQTIQEILDSIAEFKQGSDYFRTMGKFQATKQSNLKIGLSPESSLSASHYLSQLAKLDNLKHLKLGKLSQVFSKSQLIAVKHDAAQFRQNNNYCLNFEIESTDLSIKAMFQGECQQYKIGEGDQNDLQIPNEKKMWENQFTFISHGGSYFVRDCGRVHPTRVQVSQGSSFKLQKYSVIDFGNCIQFVVDLVTVKGSKLKSKNQLNEIIQNRNEAILLQPDREDKQVESSMDLPTLRLRIIWVSPINENVPVQKEYLLEASQSKSRFKIGRSAKNDLQINLKELSSEQCVIDFTSDLGWILTEKYNNRASSNGTFIFMKSHIEMIEQSPSSMVRVFDGMVLSFVNYLTTLKLSQKSKTDLASRSQALESNYKESNNFYNQTQNDTLVPQRLNIESQLSLSRHDSGSEANVRQSQNIIIGHSSINDSQTSQPTLLENTNWKVQNANYHSQDSPPNGKNFSQYLKDQLHEFVDKSESGVTSFIVKEVNLLEDNNSQSNQLQISSQLTNHKQKITREDKINQYPSQQSLDQKPTKTFNEVQTSTNFDLAQQKTLQEIAAQTDLAQQHQIETQTNLLELKDAQTGHLQQNEENGAQTESNPALKVMPKLLEDLGVQTDSTLRLEQSQARMQINSTVLSNFQSQMQMVEAISLPEIGLETVRVKLDPDSILNKEDTIYQQNERYQQETLQFSRIQYVFEIGKEDNKIALDSSETE